MPVFPRVRYLRRMNHIITCFDCSRHSKVNAELEWLVRGNLEVIKVNAPPYLLLYHSLFTPSIFLMPYACVNSMIIRSYALADLQPVGVY